jgi:ATP-binding cassette subfamily F protein uup
MAAPVLISLEDAFLTFGGKPLFTGLRLHIAQGDKICLVGKNGAGKTTLMRLITGELDMDAGKRFVLPGITIGYLAQSVEHAPTDTVRQFVLSGLAPEEQTDDRLYQADRVISPLALDTQALMGTLSGGQLRRAALARALIAAPDLLLLDEPTNHLDLTGIEWLEGYLASYPGALLCVSHDRTFLANISRKVFWIDGGIIRISPGGYRDFEDWAEQIVEQEARALQNMQKKLNAEVDWTQGGVTGRRKRNQRRLSELNRLREKLRADKAAYTQRMRKIEMDALTPVQASKIVAEFKNVSKSFTRDSVTLPILNDFSLRVMRGDRIGILGKNGSGKSTFVKLLVGDAEPDSGRIFRGKNIDIAYLDQARASLNPDATLWDTLCPDGGDHVFLTRNGEKKPWHVCGYLKAFLFDPKQARDKVSTLSGGQQNRLMLAKLLAHPGNVLILDEPTNDLDMDTLDMLQEILADYQGTLLIVSHDRDFLDRTVTEVLAFEGNAHVEGFLGGYSDYHQAKLQWAAEEKRKNAPAAKEMVLVEGSASVKPAAKMSFKYKHELEKLPVRIAALEKEIESLKELLAGNDLYMRDPDAFDIASRRYPTAQQELADAESRWLELEEMRTSTR